MPKSASESPAHLRLKRLALLWAQTQGYRIAAAEVSLPNFRYRLDVAGYRPGKGSRSVPDARTARLRQVPTAALGLTAVFECKVSRPDYLRDSRSVAATRLELEKLADRKARQEATLLLHYPSIRNGDSLFPEYETLNFERPGYEAYQETLAAIRRLASRLHGNTKFEKLTTWGAANLYYLVVEPGLFRPAELPPNWGLLVRDGDRLEVGVRPVFHDVDEAQRLALLHRIALAGTRVVNALHGIGFGELAPGFHRPDSANPEPEKEPDPTGN